MTPDGNAVMKVNYTHQALCDLILENPWITQGQIATYFGYTEGWVSQLLSADAVKEFLAERKAELMDPLLRQAINERLEGLAKQSMAVLQTKLALPNPSADLALKALEISTRSLGYGAKQAGVELHQHFVVAMPPKEVDGEAWIAKHAPASRPPVSTITDAVVVNE